MFGSHNGSNTREAVLRASALAVDNLFAGLALGVTRTAVVTGAAGGIGAATVRRARAAGLGRRRRRPRATERAGWALQLDLADADARLSGSER